MSTAVQDSQLDRLLAGLDPASPELPASVRPGLPFARGVVRAARPAARLRERFRALEAVRHGVRRRRPSVVHVHRVRDLCVGDLAHRPGSSTSAHHAVAGPALGYAWGACEGCGTRRGAGLAVLAHRPRTARRIRVAR